MAAPVHWRRTAARRNRRKDKTPHWTCKTSTREGRSPSERLRRFSAQKCRRNRQRLESAGSPPRPASIVEINPPTMRQLELAALPSKQATTGIRHDWRTLQKAPCTTDARACFAVECP